MIVYVCVGDHDVVRDYKYRLREKNFYSIIDVGWVVTGIRYISSNV